jgi:hypothetical protein
MTCCKDLEFTLLMRTAKDSLQNRLCCYSTANLCINVDLTSTSNVLCI